MTVKQKRNDLNKKERLWAYLFITPMCLQFLIFLAVPIVSSFAQSMTDYNLISNVRTFIFLDNFKELIGDIRFRKAVTNTLFLMLGIPIGMVFAFTLATLLNRKLPGKVFYRVVFYLPAASSALAIGIVWKWVFNADFGLINNLFNIKVMWLIDPNMVKVSLIIKGVWGGMGGTMLLFLAGLQNISDDYYEAADIEGANVFHKLFYITIPLITPVIFYVIITGVIGGLNAFSDNYIITNNESAITVVYYLWDKLKLGAYGLISAGAVMLGTVVFTVTLIQFKLSKKWVY